MMITCPARNRHRHPLLWRYQCTCLNEAPTSVLHQPSQPPLLDAPWRVPYACITARSRCTFKADASIDLILLADIRDDRGFPSSPFTLPFSSPTCSKSYPFPHPTPPTLYTPSPPPRENRNVGDSTEIPPHSSCRYCRCLLLWRPGMAVITTTVHG